jgi:hypothetical protein
VPFSESVGPKRKLTLETRLGNKVCSTTPYSIRHI